MVTRIALIIKYVLYSKKIYRHRMQKLQVLTISTKMLYILMFLFKPGKKESNVMRLKIHIVKDS